MAGTWGRSMFTFMILRTDFQSESTVFTSVGSYRHVVVSIFFMLAILVSVYYFMVLICIFLMINIEDFFMCLLGI